MTTFALVHGAWHGAWCWESLSPALRRHGHDVVTMDLPCDDGAASFEAYADVVCAALQECTDDVVLVGHSLAGTTIPLVANRRPVRHIVYLGALVPEVGRSMRDQLRAEDILDPAYLKGLSAPDADNRTTWVDLQLARQLFYADCAESTAAAAVTRLRPQARYPYSVPFPLTEFPAVPCTSVICSADRMVRPEWSRAIARDRLGADVKEMTGDHSPFLSRPAVLAEVLVRILDEN